MKFLRAVQVEPNVVHVFVKDGTCSCGERIVIFDRQAILDFLRAISTDPCKDMYAKDRVQ